MTDIPRSCQSWGNYKINRLIITITACCPTTSHLIHLGLSTAWLFSVFTYFHSLDCLHTPVLKCLIHGTTLSYFSSWVHLCPLHPSEIACLEEQVVFWFSYLHSGEDGVSKSSRATTGSSIVLFVAVIPGPTCFLNQFVLLAGHESPCWPRRHKRKSARGILESVCLMEGAHTPGMFLCSLLGRQHHSCRLQPGCWCQEAARKSKRVWDGPVSSLTHVQPRIPLGILFWQHPSSPCVLL